MIALISLLVTTVSVGGTAIIGGYKLYTRLGESIENNIKQIESTDKKLNMIGQGVVALMQETDGLDAERFEEALENNGFTSDDFRKDG